MQRVLLAFVFLLFSAFLHSQTIPPLQYADLGDLKLENGSVIHDCKVGYRTLGTLNPAKSNAVLYPTWFTGKSGDIVAGLRPGTYVDTSKYFVIAVDALGNGVSCSPSNSTTQHGIDFPQFSIRDMVYSEYRLVTETLHLQHLRAVMGVSMGGIQSFQWIVSYPDFMDLAIPIVGTPQMSSYDLLLWNTELKALKSDPAYKDGKYTQTPPLSLVALIHNMNLSTPDFRANHTTPEGFQQYFDQIVTDGDRFMDANDYLRQLQAIIGHDIAHGGSLYDAANKVRAKVLVVSATQDHMVNPLPALGFAKLIHAQTLLLESDCGHMAPGCESSKMDPVVDQFLSQP
ncbi:alpha/beta fold hydrolase [Alloacidobacterium dinghuense]|uniref:Alpha/beta fold hydrolase n=1 Tax=Alloacidobacterium dinghuense TaxID=2763107 RepID=A0A7G8BP82_9BACT|nr:alpha/beta fold hydrolase [Alloacidobacterium dinghuense]QNI34352.1 alpha/beta fold hydrolase [Alloacidobacterium dinghuense]